MSTQKKNEDPKPSQLSDMEARAALNSITIESFKEKGLGGSISQASPSSEIPEPVNYIMGPPPTLIREIAFMFTIASSQLLAQAGLAQGLAPANTIAANFSDDKGTQTSWFSASYTLTVGTFILIAGRLGDIYGHRLLFTLGYAWLALWSLIAGLSYYSHSIIFFDVCRALQGIGPAILLPNALAILGQVYAPGPRKNMAFAIFGAAAPNGFLIGAAFSSLIAELAWWPWAYWLTAIVCTLLAGSALAFIPRMPKDHQPEISLGSKHIDYLGSFFGIAGLVLLNLSWNQAPVVGWSKPYVIVFLILGIMSLCAFFWIEQKASNPIIPLRGLSRESVFVLAIIAFGWSSFGIGLFYYFQFVQLLRHSTPLNTVAQISPAAISGLLAAVTTGLLLSRIRISFILVFALVAFTTANVISATLPVQQRYWDQAFWAQIVMPWGMDMSFPTATIILSNLVPREHQGIAGSLVATVVNYSISIGLGIAGTVASQVGGDQDQDLLREFRGAWYTATGLSGCGVLVAVYYAFESRNRKQ